MKQAVFNNQSLEIVTDIWQPSDWQFFIQLTNQPEYAKGRFYYDHGYMRIEMNSLGANHGRDNSVVARLISLFATFKNIPVVEYTNTSYRKKEFQECQPDSSFYLGNIKDLPPRNNAPIDLDKYDPPTLVIEISSTTLSDDLGQKRLLYERLGIGEYWIIDTNTSKVIALAITDGGSKEIRVSQVLPDLEIAVIEEALKRSVTADDGKINRWLIKLFS